MKGVIIKLDTVKISKASKVLYDTNNPVTAEKLLLFKDMYVKGELDTNFMNDRNFLEALSIQPTVSWIHILPLTTIFMVFLCIFLYRRIKKGV